MTKEGLVSNNLYLEITIVVLLILLELLYIVSFFVMFCFCCVKKEKGDSEVVCGDDEGNEEIVEYDSPRMVDLEKGEDDSDNLNNRRGMNPVRRKERVKRKMLCWSFRESPPSSASNYVNSDHKISRLEAYDTCRTINLIDYSSTTNDFHIFRLDKLISANEERKFRFCTKKECLQKDDLLFDYHQYILEGSFWEILTLPSPMVRNSSSEMRKRNKSIRKCLFDVSDVLIVFFPHRNEEEEEEEEDFCSGILQDLFFEEVNSSKRKIVIHGFFCEENEEEELEKRFERYLNDMTDLDVTKDPGERRCCLFWEEVEDGENRAHFCVGSGTHYFNQIVFEEVQKRIEFDVPLCRNVLKIEKRVVETVIDVFGDDVSNFKDVKVIEDEGFLFELDDDGDDSLIFM